MDGMTRCEGLQKLTMCRSNQSLIAFFLNAFARMSYLLCFDEQNTSFDSSSRLHS